MDRLSDMRGTVNEGTPLQEEDPKSATLFKLVADIKASLAEMERMVKGQGCEDKSLKELFKELPTAYDDGKVKEKIEEKIVTVQDLAKGVSAQLKQLGDDAQNTSAEYTPAERQMRKNLHQTLSKRTQALVDEFISIRQKHTAENQRQMERQVKIVLYDSGTKGYKKNPDTNEPYTEEEVSKVAVQCYETGTSPFLEALASNTLADVQAKHQAIQNLEQRITEVAQMFSDLAILVDQQGERLDRIEANVAKGYVHAKMGVEELQKANRYAASKRKKMCCLMWVLLVVTCAVLFPILMDTFVNN